MARDPIQHEPRLLHEGLRRVNAGEQLGDTPTILEELIFLGLARVSHDGQLAITKEGQTFLEAED